MGLIAFLLMLWVICVLFPGGGGGHVDIAGALASLAAGIIVLALLVGYWGLGVAGILWLAERWDWNRDIALIAALLGPIVLPMLIAGAVNGVFAYRVHREGHP